VVNERNRLLTQPWNLLQNWRTVLAVIFIATFAVAIACGWFWMGVLAPAILRPFGVPLRFGFLRRLDRLNQHLSRNQYVWSFGVFSWGFGMFLFFVTARYLQWKLLGDRFLSTTSTLVAFLLWLIMGWLVGALGAPHHRGVAPSGRNC
jgi:hypothetical protein